jgi:Fic family protein
MLFATPQIRDAEKVKLDELAGLRRGLERESSGTAPWLRALRRSVRASSIEGSTSIEGFSVAPGEAEALTSGYESPSDDESRLAISSYAHAMDHVGAMASELDFRWHERVIRDLHFDACHFQRDKRPGLWRDGPMGVTGSDGSIEYRAPDADAVPGLMAETVRRLAEGDPDADVVVRAAMAHLHVVSVHPFRDGNGRVARIVQSLVLALGGRISPEFTSIEEYLGQNTPAYYAALRETQAGSYQPERDASGWVRFCIEAHLAQARQRLAQIEAAAARWDRLERLVGEHGWPERFAIALEQSLLGATDRATYSTEADVSAATASADLRRLLDAGLVEQRGRGRNTRYGASASLRAEIGKAGLAQRSSNAP